MAKYDAATIAEWFLYYNRLMMRESGADLISNLKLQKLLYYAQGCYLAIKNEPLFNDPIVAWDHGPVVETIYHVYKNNRSNGIQYEDDFERDIDPETTNILEQVYDAFGQYSAWGLRNMTHRESPWLDTPRNGVISQESIKQYFKEHYVE